MFHDLTRGYWLDEGGESPFWFQEAGETVGKVNHGPQQGKVRFPRSTPNDAGYSRMFTADAFGPDIDVFGWFTVVEWHPYAGDNHGVKLYTGFEDNNANNTISLLRKGYPTAWYVEDRLGIYAVEGNAGDNQDVGHQVDPTEGVRHRFLWRQRAEDSGIYGELFIDGVEHFGFFSRDPLYYGRIGWRLDGVTVDWSLAVVER